MRHYVIHAGGQRTGSTLIQTTLRRQAARLGREIVPFIDAEVRESAFFAYLAARRGLAGPAPDPGEGIALFHQAFPVAPGQTALISHEGLLGTLRAREFYGTPAYRDLVFGILAGLRAPGASIRVIFYTRPIVKLIASMYTRHVVEKGATERFADFVARLDLARYRWDGLTAAAARHLAPDEMRFRDVPGIAPAALIAAFAEDAGIALAPPAAARWTRKSPPDLVVEVVRGLNDRLSPSLRAEMVARLSALPELDQPVYAAERAALAERLAALGSEGEAGAALDPV